MPLQVPETRYAKSGDVHIAYQTVGDGPFDLVYGMGFAQHVELGWDEPRRRAAFERLASFSRLILFDKRGTGLSDPVPRAATLEERMDDIRAVLDAVGSERAAIVAVGDGGPVCALFAATYPERVHPALAPSATAEEFREFVRPLRLSVSPSGAAEMQRLHAQMDVRAALP